MKTEKSNHGPAMTLGRESGCTGVSGLQVQEIPQNAPGYKGNAVKL